MPLMLNVDGDWTKEPGPADIARAFDTLDRAPSGWFRGPGISIISLEWDEAHLLMASGTYAAGFMLSYHDGERDCEYNSDPDQALSVDQVTKIFQAYARGEEWGKSAFKWERYVIRDKTSNIVRRLIIIGFFGFIAYVVLKKITE